MTSLHVMRSPTPSPTVYAGALWLCLKYVYKSRLGDFTTCMRDNNVFLGRGVVWRILVPSWWENLHAILKVITRWWKIKTNGMHSFLFQMKLCPHIFADKNLCKFLLSYQIAALFYWTLGDTHEQLDKLTPKVIAWCWRCEHRWLKRDWMVNQLQSFYAKVQ